jgi:hypothetical protein
MAPTLATIATPSTSPRRVVRSADSQSRWRPEGSSHCSVGQQLLRDSNF